MSRNGPIQSLPATATSPGGRKQAAKPTSPRAAATAAPPWTLGSVNLPAFFVIIAMTLVSAPWGVRLAHAMDPGPLKKVFAAFLSVVALNMLRKAAGW